MTDEAMERALIVATELLEEAEDLLGYAALTVMPTLADRVAFRQWCAKWREAREGGLATPSRPSPQAPGQSVRGTTPTPCADSTTCL